VSPRRPAYTLLEVVLTLSVIVIVAAIALPSTLSMYSQHKLRAATDTVRAGWAGARSHAIDEGRPYRFAVQPNTGSFRIAPDDQSFWSGSPTIDNDHPALILEDALPTGIRFAMDGAGNSASGGSGQWTTVAVFQSDGTAQDDVDIVFQMDDSRPLVLTLRAMTGTSSVKAGGKEN